MPCVMNQYYAVMSSKLEVKKLGVKGQKYFLHHIEPARREGRACQDDLTKHEHQFLSIRPCGSSLSRIRTCTSKNSSFGPI
ncbi:hypothetical protein LguiA_009925 [Lonicera macranthoides]